ncbi:MAG: DUF983 domain-containing protein [Pseudomonadota bacterium]
MPLENGLSPFVVGASGKCPRCGRGDLFEGYLGLKTNCTVCGLTFEKSDAGDGPAVFAIFIVGFLGVVVALVARFTWGFSIPVSFGLSAVFSILLTLALLRPLKGILVALQYRYKAAEGRLTDSE